MMMMMIITIIVVVIIIKHLLAHDELGTCGASLVCSINLLLMWLQQSVCCPFRSGCMFSALSLFGHWWSCMYADIEWGGASKLKIETDHPGWMLTLTLRWGLLLTLTLGWGLLLTLTLSWGLLLTLTLRWGLLLLLTLRWGLLPGSPCQSGDCGTSALPGLGL